MKTTTEFFTLKGLLFIPRHWTGYLMLGAALAYLIKDGIELDHRMHSVSDFLMNLVFHAVIVWLGYSALAILLNGWQSFRTKDKQ